MSIDERIVISENDLRGIKRHGKYFRALCPIHGSRDRDLEITPVLDDYIDEEDNSYAGFGRCFSSNCNAKVLVQEWNPKAAARILGRAVKTAPPRFTMTAEELEEADEWQRQELTALNKIYRASRDQLKHMRAYAYLAQRGLGGQDALALLETLGVAYIPPAEEWKQAPPANLRKWCDRILFPSTCRDGERGYVGRTLSLWQPGMDENEHKRLLNEHEARMLQEYGEDAYKHRILRYQKTYKSGFFNGEIMGQYNHLYICEGPFDALPLMLAGLPNVVSIAGTRIDVKGIPKNVFDITLAFDSDFKNGQEVAKKIDELGWDGISSVFCPAPDDGRGKDWSERYRRCGLDGLSVLLEADRQRQVATSEPDLPDLGSWTQSDPGEDPDKCAVCGAVMPNQYTEEEAENSTRDFFYLVEDDDVVCYCSQCYDMETGERLVPAPAEDNVGSEQLSESTRYEQFMSTVNDISQIFGGCTITVDPPGYTLAEHVKRLQHEEAQRIRDAQSRAVARRSQ